MKLKDIEKLYADGFLSAEQRDDAIEQYRLNASGMRRWLAYSLAALAAVLISGGAVMLAVAHWMELTPMMQMGCGMGLLAAAWLGYFALRHCAPIVAEALAVVGAGAWLACIALLAELFKPGTPVVESFFAFFVGIALIPFLSRQRLLIGVVAGSSFLLYFMMLFDNESWLSLKLLNEAHGWAAAIILLLLGLFWWLFAERVRGSRGLMRGYSWLGIPAALLFLILVHIPLVYNEYIMDAPPISPSCWPLYAGVPLLFLLLKPRHIAWGCWLLLAAATSALLPAAELLHHFSCGVYGLGICAAYALILMSLGTRCGRVAWINYGSLLVVFTFIGLISNILQSLEVSGLVLITAGVGVMALALLLEWQRRRLVRRVKAEAAKQTTPAQETTPEA